jgi:hypothetical protein
MRTGYPLEALLRLRREIKQQRERLLASATSACTQAEQALADAGARAEEQQARLALALQRLGSSEPSRAAERQGRERFAGDQRDELVARRGERDQAAATVAARRDELTAARQQLLDAEAALQAVERNHRAWDQARHAEEQRRAELELEDLVAARRGGDS